LKEDNIAKITLDGILIEIPDVTGKTGQVFINNNRVNYSEQTQEYEVYIGDKYDYYFVNEEVNPDVSESEQLSNKYVKGENLIRTLEKQNNVIPTEIEIGAADIKALSLKGMTITLPDQEIESLFIENEYVTYDRLKGSCTVKIYENWNYNYRNADKNNKNILQNIKGTAIINILKSRDAKNSSLANRIAALERRTLIKDTKALAETLLLMRRENISQVQAFDIKIEELKDKAKEMKGLLKDLESKNEQYKTAVKYLLAFQKYLPVKQELESKSLFTKKRFKNKYESELLAFDHAAKQLEKIGLNTNVDPEKAKILIKNQDKKMKELTQAFKEVQGRIDELRNAKKLVSNILQPTEISKKLERKKDREI
jgi:hypothetical protein